MRKFLHLSLVCLMAMFCGTTFAQTVFDFDNDYQTLFPTLAGVSSNESHDGDFTEATTSTPQNGITVTVSAKASGSNENRIWTSTPRLRMYSGTLTVTAPQGRNITSIEFRTNDKWDVTPNVGTLNDREWTGSAQSVEFTVGGNSQINSLTVLLEGETIETVKYIKATTVESGKQYLIVADVDGALKIAQPVSSNYGFLDVEDANVVDDAIEIEENSTLPFTITSADGGYTIMQSDGRYLYQSGDYDLVLMDVDLYNINSILNAFVGKYQNDELNDALDMAKISGSLSAYAWSYCHVQRTAYINNLVHFFGWRNRFFAYPDSVSFTFPDGKYPTGDIGRFDFRYFTVN